MTMRPPRLCHITFESLSSSSRPPVSLSHRIGPSSLRPFTSPSSVNFSSRHLASVASSPLITRSLHTSVSRDHAAHANSPSLDGKNLDKIPEISMDETYDIVIIGGGPAGLALACAIQSEPALRDTKVLLLEGGSLEPVRGWKETEWSNRVSSITAENVSWLESIGGWTNVSQNRSWPVEEMVIWSNPSSHSKPTIHFPPLGHPMARMTENINLQRGLLKTLESGIRSSAGVVIRENARVGEMRMSEGGGWVGLKVGSDWVRGSLVIGADGPNSPVRQFANISTYGHAYSTHAVVCTLLHRPPSPYTNNTAFQRFLPTGPLAFLPLSPTASTMVWSTTPELAAAYKRLGYEALVPLVNAGFAESEKVLKEVNRRVIEADEAGRPLSVSELETAIAMAQDMSGGSSMGSSGGVMKQSIEAEFDPNSNSSLSPPMVTGIPASSIASFPLKLSHADTYTSHRLALLGDAAHTVHPLAGQGLNMGLADARSLTNTLAAARTVGSDLGSITALAPYPRERYAANHILLSATDKLNWIFKSRGVLVDGIRGLGLEVIHELGWVKKAFMAAAGAVPSEREGPVSFVNKKNRREAWDRFGRSDANDEKDGFGGKVEANGWPSKMADGLEGWVQLKQAAEFASQVVGAGIGNGLRRVADILQKR